MKLTKQGVRDLDTIKSKKPAGRTLSEMPRDAEQCKHRNKSLDHMHDVIVCCDCHEILTDYWSH